MDNQSYYEGLKQRLENANHGEKKAMIASAANFLGKSEMTIHRNLKKLGYASGRKRRSDKGNTSISRDELLIISGILRHASRKNKKDLTPIKAAIEEAYESGAIKAMYHEATVARLLRENKLSVKQLKRPTPHVRLRSPHPNYMWQIDPSICVLYYLKKGAGMAVMDRDKFYKNKPQNFAKIANERVFRYVATDHCTGAFYCKYYLASGENREILFDFLLTAMGEKDRQKNPFEGVPKMIYWDKGSANDSGMIKGFLDQLGVKHGAHIAGNSRAKGQVEVTNNIIERYFEGKLSRCHVNSIDELNEYCELWQRDFQENPRYAHSRHKMPRFVAWRKIKPEQLIERPPVEVCKMLLSDKPFTRQVRGDYRISFEGKTYSVGEVDNVAINEDINVMVNPYAYPSIWVEHENRFGEMVRYEIEPLEEVDEYGNLSDSKLADAALGGHYHTAKLTQTDFNRKEVDERTYGTKDEQEIDKLRAKKVLPFDGEIDPISYLKDRNDNNDTLRIPKRGKALDVGEPALQKVEPRKAPSLGTVERDEPVLPVLNFIKWYAKNHDITPEINAKIRETYAAGLRESDYETAARDLFNANSG